MVSSRKTYLPAFLEMMNIRQLKGRFYVHCTCSILSTSIACLVSLTNETEADKSLPVF